MAAGDVSGRISMWNGFAPAVAAAAAASEDKGAAGEVASQFAQQQGQKRKSREVRDAGLAKETLHWHSSAVRSIVFSQDGSYLLSGGAEAVLVRTHSSSAAAVKSASNCNENKYLVQAAVCFCILAKGGWKQVCRSVLMDLGQMVPSVPGNNIMAA